MSFPLTNPKIDRDDSEDQDGSANDLALKPSPKEPSVSDDGIVLNSLIRMPRMLYIADKRKARGAIHKEETIERNFLLASPVPSLS